MLSPDFSLPLEDLDDPGQRIVDATLDGELGRRLEDWIVTNLDDRGATSSDADWEELLGRLAPSRWKSATAVRERPRAPGGWTRFRVGHRRGITVVAILDASLVREDDLAELSGDLVALIEAGHHRLVIDFANVEHLSIRAVGALTGAIRGCSSASGGALKLAGLHAEVVAVLRITGLSSEVEICPDAASAISGPWPEAEDLRPLPVSVLSALMGHPHATEPQSDRRAKAVAEEVDAMIGVRLVARSEPFEGRAVAADGPRLVIGRASDCGLRLGFATVSRHHAAIERRGGRVELVDLGSTNGTGLNGRTIHGASAVLCDGDEVRIGPLTFAIAIESIPMRSAEDPEVGILVESALGSPLDEGSPGDTAFPSENFTIADLGPDLPLKFEVIAGVVVVTPRLAGLDDETTIDGLRAGLEALSNQYRSRRIVVNLAHVGHISGRAIGVLLAHHLRLNRDGGALRVSEANPRVAAVLEGVHLGMLMECHPTVDEAVLAAWPGAGDEGLV
jgi:anti-anti-sigma factor